MTTTAGSPGAIHRSFRAIEALEDASIALGWNAEYRQLSAGPMVAGVAVDELSTYGLHYEWSTAKLEVACATPASNRVLIINTSRSPLFINCERVSGGNAFLGAPSQHCDAVSHPGVMGLTVFLPDEALAHTGLPADGKVLAFDPTLTARLVSTAVVGRLLGAGGPQDLSFEADLDAMLASGSNATRERTPGWRRVARAREWIEANLHESFPMYALQRVLDVSPSTLLRDFRRTVGESPYDYVRARRLDQARRRIQASLERGQPVSISAIALDSGFRHLGRFSADFRNQFGELPSQLVRESRQSESAVMESG